MAGERAVVNIKPEPSSGLPTFNAEVTAISGPLPPLGIWGPPGPWVGWPADPGIPGNTPPNPGTPPTLPAASARWEFSDGWYFCWGPFDRPRPIPGLGFGNVSSNLDPLKSDWKTLDGQGWTFVSGPYDKPFPIFSVEAPPTEPPTEPPVSAGCRWTFTGTGWVLVCGPYDKPKPIHP